MSSLELKVYDLFKNKLGEKEAATLIEYIEAKTDKKYEDKKDVLATKDDLAQVRKEIAESKTDIIKWLVAMWVAQMAAIVFLIVKK